LLGRHVPATIGSACYRIAQEALSNTSRHADPRSTLLSIEVGARTLRLTIRDDGRGFDTRVTRRRGGCDSGSLGLISMAERAKLAGGTLEVTSELGSGTLVRAVFPIAPRREDA
jgi:signal transduction histidine kinase